MCPSSAQAVTAPVAAGPQDRSSGPGRRPVSKAVTLGPTPPVRLIGALQLDLRDFLGRPGQPPGAIRWRCPGKGRTAPGEATTQPVGVTSRHVAWPEAHKRTMT